MDGAVPDPPLADVANATPLQVTLLSERCFLCEALRRVLETDPGVAAIQHADAAEVVALGLPAGTDAVLVCTATEAPSVGWRLRRVAPRVPIVACGLLETEEAVIAWAEAGVSGYISRQTPLADFVGTLRGILSGEQFSSPRIVAALLNRFAAAPRMATAPPQLSTLTRRERQIAELIAAERADKDIARLLNISLATTKFHVHNLLRKLGVQRRSEVADMLPQREQSSAARELVSAASE